MTQETIVTVAQRGLDAKREEAKAWLGKRWISHPDYRFDPRHSNNPDIFNAARQPFLANVRLAASADRNRNPAFLRAEQIRITLSVH